MKITSDRDEHGTLSISITVPEKELKPSYADTLRTKLQLELDEAFDRWGTVTLGMVPPEPEPEADAGTDETAEPEPDEPLRDWIEVGDWVKVWMDGKMTVVGQLVTYTEDGIVIRSKWGKLTDLWPARILCVDQIDEPKNREI